MIVKMKFINISGPQDDIDRMMALHLSNYEIQLESALSELKRADTLRPFMEANPYHEALNRSIQLIEQFQLEQKPGLVPDPSLSLSLEEMFELVRKANERYTAFQAEEDKKKQAIEELHRKRQVIAPFRPLDYDLHELFAFRFIHYSFGRIELESYQRLQKYVLDDLGVIFIEGERDDAFVYGAYFVSAADVQKVETALHSLHFEKIELPRDDEGTPTDIYRQLTEKIRSLERQIEEDRQEERLALVDMAPRLFETRDALEELANNFDVRKLAARVGNPENKYYILCGWMAEDDVENFLAEVADDDKVFVVVEEDRDAHFGEPPTKLKNPKLFKPFEMFIHMYGLPAPGETDPTIFVGLSYSFIFGAMFGDVGQGFLLFLIGGLIYKFKKSSLAGVIATAGIFSTMFGFIYGSVFGFEHVVRPLWIRPIEHMTALPFIGKLNTVFVVAVAFGMAVIVLAMVIHIINAIRNHDVKGAWFDPNGITGLVFYASAVVCILLFMTGHEVPGGLILAAMFGVPLLLILFKEPITGKMEKERSRQKEGKALFLVEGFFELFEILLSYFSNTLSFVRIGAFAVSHAAIMQVVLMLSGFEQGSINWVVVILGNLFVCGLEGLIVGIQVLRLEYYEMFSRFYQGKGRAFVPYTK